MSLAYTQDSLILAPMPPSLTARSGDWEPTMLRSYRDFAQAARNIRNLGFTYVLPSVQRFDP